MTSETLTYPAYVAMGANLGDPLAQIQSALKTLSEMEDIRVVAVSQFYRSAPLGPPGQPDYCNAVCAIQCSLAPLDLLSELQRIEMLAGRKRDGERWSARVLDLDLLHIEGVCLDLPTLHLPHPQIAVRNFVVIPFAEVAPTLVIPDVGPIAELAKKSDWNGLMLWSETDRNVCSWAPENA